MQKRFVGNRIHGEDDDFGLEWSLFRATTLQARRLSFFPTAGTPPGKTSRRRDARETTCLQARRTGTSTDGISHGFKTVIGKT